MESRRYCYLGMVNTTTRNVEWVVEEKASTTNYRYSYRKYMEKDQRRF
jgi:hypothetical protein